MASAGRRYVKKRIAFAAAFALLFVVTSTFAQTQDFL